VACLLATVVYGIWSTKCQTIRAPIFAGNLILTAGTVGLATIQPADSLNALCFAGLSGLGFAGPLVLVIAGVQLSTPHHLIATATAVTTSIRAVFMAVSTAIFSAAFNARMKSNVPHQIGVAVTNAGLPESDISSFLLAFTTKNSTALDNISGATPAVRGAAAVALKQATADSIRVVYIIAAPFGVIACIACLFLGDMRKTMNYKVDAPIEDLTAKSGRGESSILTSREKSG
jgi:hypothetical protein